VKKAKNIAKYGIITCDMCGKMTNVEEDSFTPKSLNKD